ncbi:fungal-specific transcription factor domain-containing protein [Dactylonectria estremocensis]|uniref:Fungal-specific transcription factor domain-containing protein n=1 Tax=Dactylonectria estremocensis TaxID=1079267 RepID=A0A9P9J945_9HYPO|nr:fungal-specific transcription factor domain-containing protein [Dactylonectria estremocensis]
MDKVTSRPRPAKRKRISRACDPCRARKHRCDGRQPTCSACSMTQHPCSYDSGTKKRGLPTGYVRSLELLWALVFTVVPNSMSIVNKLIPEIQFALDSHARLGIVSRLVNDPEILRQVWEDSDVQTELDHLLANVQDSPHTPTDIGKKKESSPDLPRFTVRSFEAIQSELERPPGEVSKIETPSLPRLSIVPAPTAKDVGSTTFPPNARRLLDLYFAHTHCWLPIVQKHKMFEILYSSSWTALADTGSLAVFWAILAYSSLQESKGRFSLAGAPGGCGDLFTAEQLYAKARRQIPNEEPQDPDYTQALLVLSLFKLDLGEFAASWHLIGQALRIALDLGSPLDSSGLSTAASNSMDDKMTRLLLSCFVLDTIVSCHLGKPPHLRTAYIRLLSMPAETGPDEWEPQSACLGDSDSPRRPSSTWDYQPLRTVSIFNRYVDLIRILNDAMSGAISEELYIKLLSALHCWYDQLPEHCVLPSPSSQISLEGAQGLSPQLVHLYLAFKSTEMFLKAQQSSIPRHGPSPSASTPGAKGSSISSTIGFASTFATKLSVSTMPAVFTSYKAICDRKPTRFGLASLSTNSAKSNPPGNYQLPVSSSDSVVNYLLTPTEHPEFVVVGGTGTVSYAGLCFSSIVDTMHDHEKETPKGLFDIVEAGEAGVSNFSYHGDLDHLDVMEWLC